MVLSRYRFFSLILTVALLFFVVNRTILNSAFSTALSVAAYPVLKVQYYFMTPVKNLLRYRASISQLETQLEYMRAENYDLRARATHLEASLQFMDDTKELREFQKRYRAKKTGILSQIILKQFSEQGHIFYIDAGARQGVEPDMIAVYKNSLVGRVTHVYPLYSIVQLISDPQCNVAAFCPKTKAHGIYQGTGSTDSATINHVNHLQKLQKDDVVISSGKGLVFPRGFALGKLDHFEVNGVHWDVRVVPVVDLHAINYCYVVNGTTS